ncbi:MAG: thiamine ABC transporter ATP-binding protein [Gammaproteobacteria bacterium]|nr:MAG: thiamine ABC transporter ATP-binding protein [Gammaproteobacteria bacterium]
MIALNDVSFSYGNDAPTLHFDLSVQQGEKVALVGPSGVGKSTLLSLIVGFAFAQQGEIWLAGERHVSTPPHQRPVSILFQDHNLFDHLSVEKNIALGIAPNLKLSDKQRRDIESIAEKVGLGDYLKRLPSELSGGQQQRVALARCLLRERPILLLDEPFSALDKDLRQEMLALLTTLCDEKGLTLLMVTHQPEELHGFVDRIVSLG